jgi:hypothetical protein
LRIADEIGGYRYDAEARVWLQKWADYLEALTAHNVVPLRAA